jgi:hypothetical protein
LICRDLPLCLEDVSPEVWSEEKREDLPMRPPNSTLPWLWIKMSMPGALFVASISRMSLHALSTPWRRLMSPAWTKWNPAVEQTSLHSSMMVWAASSLRPTMMIRSPGPSWPWVLQSSRTVNSPMPLVAPTNTAVSGCLLTNTLLAAVMVVSLTIMGSMVKDVKKMLVQKLGRCAEI